MWHTWLDLFRKMDERWTMNTVLVIILYQILKFDLKNYSKWLRVKWKCKALEFLEFFSKYTRFFIILPNDVTNESCLINITLDVERSFLKKILHILSLLSLLYILENDTSPKKCAKFKLLIRETHSIWKYNFTCVLNY